jgi:periplasmic protein TonB
MHIKPIIMTSNEILKADILDILFDNRNKQYGAYALRKQYNQRLGWALGISLSIALLLFLFVRPERSRDISRPGSADDLVVRTQTIPEIKKPDPIIPKKNLPTPPVRQVAFVNPVIKEDKDVTTTVPDQNALLKGLVSTQNLNGIDVNGEVPVIKESVSENPRKEEPKITAALPVQREPEFPGGQEAWLNFLRKNLIPPAELEPGEKKTVAIRFSVSADGAVTDFEVLQSSGKIYDNEVIRVLKKMPKWKPAIQDGLPVARAFTQPVSFIGVEE